MADSVLKGMGGGAAKGASLGAQLGSVIPGVGNAVGAVGGAVIGAIGGGVKSKKAINKVEEAKAMTPGFQDPTQAQRLAEIDQIAKNIQSGTDASTQTAVGQIGAQTAQTQSRLARVTGGNVGSTVDALLKAQKAGADASNQAIAQGQQRLPFFSQMGQQLADRIEQRKFDLGMLNRGQTLAEGMQAQKENVINSNSAVATGLGMNELGAAGDRIGQLMNGIKLGQQKPTGNTQGGLGSSPFITQPQGMAIDPSFANQLPNDMSGGGFTGTQIPTQNIGAFAGMF